MMTDKHEPIPIKDEDTEIDINYVDKIIKLDDGTTLIGRVLIFEDDDQDDDNLHVHSPMLLWYEYDEVEVKFQKWVLESDDLIYAVPLHKVMNISTPERIVGIKYASGFTFDDDLYPDFSSDIEIPKHVH